MSTLRRSGRKRQQTNFYHPSSTFTSSSVPKVRKAKKYKPVTSSEKGKKRHNFSPKRQAWVSEFKKEVVRSPSDFDFITFFDRRFLSKLYEFLKTKIPDIEEESVKKWVQRHPWITHPVLLQPPNWKEWKDKTAKLLDCSVASSGKNVEMPTHLVKYLDGIINGDCTGDEMQILETRNTTERPPSSASFASTPINDDESMAEEMESEEDVPECFTPTKYIDAWLAGSYFGHRWEDFVKISTTLEMALQTYGPGSHFSSIKNSVLHLILSVNEEMEQLVMPVSHADVMRTRVSTKKENSYCLYDTNGVPFIF